MSAELKMKIETFHTVDCYNLQDYIRSVTGHKYEIIAMEECGNDSTKTYSVTGFISDYDKKFELPEWTEFKQTGKIDQYSLGMILNGLAEDNHIPKGKYIVEICW